MGMQRQHGEYIGCTPSVYGVHTVGMRDACRGYVGYTLWVCGVHTAGTLPESNSANSAKVICNNSEATVRLNA